MKLIHTIPYRFSRRSKRVYRRLAKQNKNRRLGAVLFYESHALRSVPTNLAAVKLPQELSLTNPPLRYDLIKASEKFQRLVTLGKAFVLDAREVKGPLDVKAVLYLQMIVESTPQSVRSQIYFNPPSDSVAKEVFDHVGITQICQGIIGRRPRRPDVVNWAKSSGSNVDLGLLVEHLEAVNSRVGDENAFFTGVSEAVTNVLHHAYSPSMKEKNSVRWWALHRIDDRKDRERTICVVLGDLGIGIPASLRDKSYLGLVPQQGSTVQERLIEQVNDAAAIKHAAQAGRTHTQLPNRGKGLPQIVECLRDIDERSEVTIFSGKGVCQFKNDGTVSLAKNFANSMKGTIVCWSIPF